MESSDKTQITITISNALLDELERQKFIHAKGILNTQIISCLEIGVSWFLSLEENARLIENVRDANEQGE